VYVDKFLSDHNQTQVARALILNVSGKQFLREREWNRFCGSLRESLVTVAGRSSQQRRAKIGHPLLCGINQCRVPVQSPEVDIGRRGLLGDKGVKSPKRSSRKI